MDNAASFKHRCLYCDEAFGSKNKLFTHLRNSPCSTQAAADGLELTKKQERVALIFGVACSDWRLPLWRALDAARGGGVSYAASDGPPGAAFASDRHGNDPAQRDLPKACDVLSLSTEVVPEEERDMWCAKANAALPEEIRIFGRSGPMPPDWHAERGIVRRYFACLLPMKLLLVNGDVDAGAEEAQGADAEAGGYSSFPTIAARKTHAKKGHQAGWGDTADGENLLGNFFRLKEILRKMQGEHLFHNFSELSLKPGDTAARRFVYRCRAMVDPSTGVAGFHASVDSLVSGQLRAMSGLAIALQHGLLPDKYLDIAFSEDRLIPVPSLPKGTEFQTECIYRKDFHHLLQPFFKSAEAVRFRTKVEAQLEAEALSGTFLDWFRDELVPSAAKMAAQLTPMLRPADLPEEVEVPAEYAEVLRLLRQAEACGKWPPCSKGREKVIKDTTLPEQGGAGGSFSVGSVPAGLDAPHGNRLFPELALCAFELERVLRPTRRSSTIAINKRAQFLPHVDSGTGAGQGISLIVGLGNYSGGELVVEGTAYDIRYKPLEFNGWTQRHWTQPFLGERFSLVWFTPAGCEDMPGLELFRDRAASKRTVCGSIPATPAAVSLPTARLHNGLDIPRLGFGTWQLQAPDAEASGTSLSCEQAIAAALDAGYRLIDTASIYKNEVAVGQALQNWPEDSGVFVTSKCSPYEMGYEKAQEACRKSLERLGRKCLDLYLIHWPALPKKPHSSPEHRRARYDTWRALEDLYRQGLVRAIGVSNFTAEHLEQLVEDGASIMPMVNQIEVHPLCVPRATLECCRKHNILIEAYAPLGGGPASNVGKASGGEVDGTRLLLEHPVVNAVAKEVSRAPAQVILRWGLQQDFLVIPRSSNAARIQQNANIFDFTLSDDQMRRMDLSSEDGRKFCWNPSSVA
ncbi:unnamed protein product [Symbiodinium natans]|uniref:NADP-dependent oxidoreductase domain-containing protein n=1 Tax=Symbiodinium natans TaxID=878477 RepID=A0A812NUK5_9DINO|nr:unnamed protein product [Symbiodinium natans]